ncbi:MAG: T9SS type A sorting domain-containing protein, partial [Ferruginibacter sp.]
SYGNMQFFLARERGAMYSAKFAADLALGTAPTDLPGPTTVAINGHNITKYVYKNTINYFLRLPDGNLNGAGFQNNNYQSLLRLRTGAISTISTVGVNPPDNPIPQPQATYTSWDNLTTTIRAIILAEKVTGTQSFIHTASSDAGYNPNDHSDHYNTGIASLRALTHNNGSPSNLTWVGINSFMDYYSSAQTPNLSANDFSTAAALFSLQVMSISEAEYQNDFNSGHVGWLPMDYFLVTKNPSGSAPFTGGRGTDTEQDAINAGNTDMEKAANSNGLAEIPMIVSVTSPAYIEKDISILISPLEKGQVNSSIYDMAGNLVAELITTAENRDPHLVTLKQAVKTKGTYLLKTTLNNKYFETRKIVVE